MSSSSFANSNRYLVFGGQTGWIGQKLVDLLREQNKEVFVAQSRLENIQDVQKELDTIKPTHVLNAAGLTGRPNVDWCEDHKDEVIRVNVIGTLGLLDSCETRKIHCTNFATGCIYTYDTAHPVGGKPFTENDPPNYVGSFYSLTKGMVDKLAPNYSHCLTLRLRMPISDDLSHRNFITKISGYAKIINVPNSVTILHDMLPISVLMADRKLSGVFNFTNPGVMSHNEVLDLYRDYIDPNFWYENFTEEDQNKILKAGRCNNHLDVTKLQDALPDVTIPTVQESMVGVYTRMKENLQKAGQWPPAPRKGPKPSN